MITFRMLSLYVLFVLLGCASCVHQRKHDPDLTDPPNAPVTEPAAEVGGQFEAKARIVRRLAEKVSQGTALVARWHNSSNGQLLVLVYRDETPPEKKQDGTWLIVSQAEADGQVISTIAVALPSLEPGTYSCGGEGARIGAALGNADWNPTSPSTSWSMNGSGSCRITLRRTPKGDLEGVFSGRLVANDGSGSYSVDRGYLYIASPGDNSQADGACASNDGSCYFKLGVRCHNAKEYECAFKAFAVACKLSVGDACYNLGVMFDNGEYVPTDYDKALSLYNKACEMDITDAPKAYLKVLLKACEAGNAGACALTGILLTKGKLCGSYTMPPELDEGQKYLCRGCRGGAQLACTQLKRMELRCPR